MHTMTGRLRAVVVMTAISCCWWSFGQAATPAEMVEITIEITEIDANKAHDLGIRWLDTLQAGEVATTVSGRVPEALPEIPSLITAGEWSRYTPFSAELKLLQERGAAKILSKPKLLAKSGSSARFVVGGEFPVTATGTTSANIDWKEYGIKTEITPRVLDGSLVDLTLDTEVSRIDWSKTVQGYPVITKRRASSNVVIKSEQTLTLAGMIETSNTESRAGIPLLSDIPLLGYLFSRQTTIENRSNIVIFVTPRIVR